MGIRNYFANSLIGMGRKFGRSAGKELMVELSDHSIDIEMVNPNRKDLAWDDNLYKHGNVFVEGYANPIKPRVDRNKDLEDPDLLEHTEGSQDGTDVDEDGHVRLISSDRFWSFMHNHLIEQMLNPSTHWRMIVYAVIALAILQVMTLVVSLSAAGAF